MVKQKPIRPYTPPNPLDLASAEVVEDAVATLKAVLGLWEDPTKWTQGMSAKGADGRYALRSEEAVCWCLDGAIVHVRKLYSHLPVVVLGMVAEERGFLNYVDFNDEPGRNITEMREFVQAGIDKLSKLGV